MAFLFSFVSTLFQEGTGLLLSLFIVFVFIMIGIIGDTIGLAAATSKERYFHAIAAKNKGSKRRLSDIFQSHKKTSDSFLKSLISLYYNYTFMEL